MHLNSIGQSLYSPKFSARLIINGKEIKSPKYIRDYEERINRPANSDNAFKITHYEHKGDKLNKPYYVNSLYYNHYPCHDYYNKNYLQVVKDMQRRIAKGQPLESMDFIMDS